ncbi:phosphotransferase [Thiomicrorhabdus heinhorstiae]|uniref:Aminoglycoside phosphotransferase family protein n=1 Tax=Thiomicrorhabdus heinhorstiae TaxID=2748010 RepID=A0ABS0BXZ5_9GAMM|nr:aminoglycoside phosphotransferase family protein [Thiomicrorhabdus heinhorstiae]MBF6058665.1 aminoglycoside phosphotransferase family protein [Thiomicrorhabdus heinhorstiae]
MHKTPAFLDHRHGPDGFQSLTVSEQNRLGKILSIEAGVFEVLPSSYHFPEGFFRYRKDLSQDWSDFYKVLPAKVLPLEKHSARFEKQLLQQGVLSRQMDVSQQGDFCICHLPYMQLQPFAADSESSRKLGNYLAEVHDCLQTSLSVADVEEIKHSWLKRLASFQTCWQSFRDRSVSARNGFLGVEAGVPCLTESFIHEFEMHLELLNFPLSDAQVVHGDLNPGNVLQRTEDKAPIIIDFENSHYSFLPRVMDVGMLIHRVFWIQRDGNPNVLDACREFLQAYGAFSLPMSLSDAMIACCLRSQCVLIERFQLYGVWYDSEWKKFINLIEQVKCHADTFDKLVE